MADTSPATLMLEWQQATANVLRTVDWENAAWASEFSRSMDDVERNLISWAREQDDTRRVSGGVLFLSTVLELVRLDHDDANKEVALALRRMSFREDMEAWR